MMNSSFIIVFLSLSSLYLIKFSAQAAPECLYHSCPNTSLFAPDSSYRSKFHALVSYLSSAAAHSIDGFANATTGRNAPDQAYGFFLCRGDLDTTTCSRCVAVGKRGILERCPDQRVSAIWYDECMLWYSNRAIFSAIGPSPNRVLHNNRSVADPTRFMRLLGETLHHVAARASAGGSRKKVAAAEANFTSSQKLYTLVQCTPYLTASDCYKCLRFGIANLSQGKQGGRFLAPSCNLRYELYQFYNASALRSPPLPPSPSPAHMSPAPVTGPEAQSNKLTVIAIVVVALSLGPVFLFYAYCRRRKDGTTTDAVVPAPPIGSSEIPTPSTPVLYTLATLEAATEQFSDKNKLGGGGFGDVFKGKLPNGQLIAVKRQSQGWTHRHEKFKKQFKNEVDSLARAKHANLVRLLGFCLEGVGQLVYEYVQNGSLERFIFDPERSRLLNWPTRYEIACGIARGMRYLHEMGIIHLDLKPDNILLDSKYKPQISQILAPQGFLQMMNHGQKPNMLQALLVTWHLSMFLAEKSPRSPMSIVSVSYFSSSLAVRGVGICSRTRAKVSPSMPGKS